MESKYLDFEEIPHEGKTKRFLVKNKSGQTLGGIGWHGPWRKYVWYSPKNASIFDTTCLTDIKNFIEKLMYERALLKRSDKDGREYKSKLQIDEQ